MFSGKEFIVEDEEAKNVAKNYKSGALLELRSGDYIATSGIESIADPELVPYWKGYILEKDGRSFIRDGVRVKLETDNLEEIEYKPNPRYELMRKSLSEKMKMLSDNSRTLAQEESSREIRKSK